MAKTNDGNPIPDPYEWTQYYETCYKMVDDEHKGLFDAITEVEKENNEEALTACYNKVKTHFSNEEKIMEESDYKKFPGHRALHTQFEGRLKRLTIPVSKKEIFRLKEWLCDHIIKQDFQYKDLLTAAE